MKILEGKDIEQYSYMRTSLSSLKSGRLEDAIIAANVEMTRECRSEKERMDIAMYVARIYAEMGEYGASNALLTRTLRYGIDEGRIFAQLAVNHAKCGDAERASYYSAHMDAWNRAHDMILDTRGYAVDGEIREDESVLVRQYEESVNAIVDKAWSLASAGDTKGARARIMTLGAREYYRKYELIATLDMIEHTHSHEAVELYDMILSSEIDSRRIMELFYLFDRLGNMEGIIMLARKAIADRHCTARIAEIYATALYNVGEREAALEIMSRLDALFGDVMTSVRTFKYMISHHYDAHVPLYNARYLTNEYGIQRDAALMRLIMGKNVDDIARDRNIIALIHSMFGEGIVSMATETVLSMLAPNKKGRAILTDALLDTYNTSATMQVHVVRALLDYEDHIKVVYDDMYNDVTYTEPCGMTDAERAKYKDKYAYMIVVGEI